VQAPKVLQHEITFDGITFSYHNRERVTLKDFNLTIPARKIVAIVGANGAGKSTLLKLLCRLYDPDAGTIKFDGVDVRDFSVEELRRMTTVLFQSPVHYSATVKENIEIGNLNAGLALEQMEDAAKSSGADVTIELLPDRYESLLGSWFPGGTELSSGEWQRIALARAFLRDSPLILLDEPTSSMDPWAETDWVERLLKRAVDRTVIIVTHRFTTAMYADVIHVMQDGRIIESGSHDELLSYQGRYAESWASQMRYAAAT
jgi:ATP-binding cassette subfamily B protein